MTLAAVQISPLPRSRDEGWHALDPVEARAGSAEPWNLLPAIRERIGAVLVGVLIFSIVLATAGFVASYDGRRRTAAFESDGRATIGAITKKFTRSRDQAYWTKAFHGGADDQEYWVELCFTTPGRGYHCGTIVVPNGTYDGMRIGSPLKVTYVSSHPDWFYVGDEVPSDPDSHIFTRMFQFCTLAGLVAIMAIAAMVFWQRGDGMPGQPAGVSPTDDVALRFRQRHGLGRRRESG